MLIDESTTESFPKTLLIRNTEDGMIWQIYHVNNGKEAEILAENALSNGFLSSTLEDHYKDEKETWPDWRETAQDRLKAVMTVI